MQTFSTVKFDDKHPELLPVSKRNLITKRDNFKMHYEMIQELGKGSFGKVMRAKHRTTGNTVAVKVIDKLKNYRYLSAIEKELTVLRQLDHPNVVKFLEWYDDMRNLYLVFELCEGGELFEALSSHGPLDEVTAALVFRQLLLGLNFLHKRNLCHRDIKADNVLLLFSKQFFPIKIIDFGLAVEFADPKLGRLRLTQMVGTPTYVAPEVLKQNYDEKCDLWSAGVLLFFMVTGQLPFTASNELELFDLIKKGKYHFPEGCLLSEDCVSLIESLLVTSPDSRVSAEEALLFPWVADIAGTNSPMELHLKPFEEYAKLDQLQKMILAYLASRTGDVDLIPAFKAFLRLDVEHRGSLKSADLLRIDNCNNYEDSKESPSSKSDEISYLEFSSAFIGLASYSAEKISEAFEFFDHDRNGKICENDLKQVLGMNIELPSDSVRALYTKYDRDHDGTLNLSEFSQVLKAIHCAVQQKICSSAADKVNFVMPEINRKYVHIF